MALGVRGVMMQRDYILRMIEELGAVLVALRNAILGRTARATDVEDTLRRASAGAGMDLDLARAASIDALPAMMAPTGEVDPARCWLLAEVLMTDGVSRLSSGETELARSSLAKAAALFTLVAPEGAFLAGFPEADERIEEIEAMLAGITPSGNGRSS